MAQGHESKGKLGILAGLLVVAGLATYAFMRPNAGEQVVLRHLNDPDSAQFGQSFRSKRDNDVWCGEVNARNRMGGYVGKTRYVAKVHAIPEMSTVTFGSTTGEDTGLQGQWRVYCE